MTNSKDCPKKVLVVDDTIDFREFCQELVATTCPDCQVTMAEDGKEALEIAGEETFDLIISDTNMPRLHGPGFIRGVRDLGIKTPAILLYSDSIQVSHLDSSQVFNCGATVILSKTDFAEVYQRLFYRYLEG